ncbi:DEAD/DEAH box helicase [Niallia circulans]|uniref:DEAD/DEAH box helicase n=1 Tax=Niallia circulans TaxID=1397 RepID=UPI001560935B|nr:DEAD/DEAH box helicase [Niallia circulans]NRG34426.1 DEAD/DEAH box helicase [Niallia circulans]
MELLEYIHKKEKQVEEMINSSFFRNQYGQIFAKKMGANFKATYNESTIWGYALFLSSASAKVLTHRDSPVCMQGLKVAAELFETFSLMSEEYDKDYAKILSALCYDLSGFQANSSCILESLEYKIEENTLLDRSVNNLFSLVTLLLRKQLQAIKPADMQLIGNSENNEMEYLWGKAINEFTKFQLTGVNGDFNQDLAEAKELALNLRDATLTTMLTLLEFKMGISYKRTTWTVLSEFIKESSEVWEPYLRLLATNPYSNNKLVPPEERLSQSEFWKSQINAINKGVLDDNRGFIIQMPTSAGKTLIAELSILQQVGSNKKCLYIAPFRSLVNEVENSLSNRLSKLGYVVSSLSGSYELDELDQFWLREADVLVATPEKVDFLIRVKPELFDDISLFIFDEGHVLGNLDSRSAQFELLLTRLKRWFTPKHSRFLFISAVMPDADSDEFAKWLINNDKAKIESPKQYDGQAWQPTRRLIGSFSWNGTNGQVEFENYVQNISGRSTKIFIPNFINPLHWEIIKGKKKKKITEKIFPNFTNKSETTAILAYRYLREGSVLIYCATVGRGGGGGVYSVLKAFLKLIDILDKYYDDETHFPKIDDSEALEAAIRWYGVDSIITQCISRGVAPHFGDLADEVRKAVEREYAQKKLKILVATHTLGQGVNLPIKTLLVYSLDIIPNPSERLSVKVRDFWNIVGRSGRAGRETEGQVVFVINSARDRVLYNEYSNPLNSERVRSIFTVAMELHREGRISQQALQDIIAEYSEPALMNFLVEEVVDTPDQQLLESFVGDTLFKIQSIEEDSQYVNSILLDTANRFWSIEPRERKVVFARTGLTLNSCMKIEEALLSSQSLSMILDEENEVGFLKLALKCIKTCEEMKPKDALKNVSIVGNTELEPFILSWINGDDLDHLRKLWSESVGEEYVELMNVYIEDCLAYRYPWGITSVIFIASYILQRDWNSLSKSILSLPSKIKNGLNDTYALWLKDMGLTSRKDCLLLSKSYDGSPDLRSFINWFVNLQVEDINKFGLNSTYGIRNIYNLISKIHIKDNHTSNFNKTNHSFNVKGVPYDAERIKVAKIIKVGDNLLLKRQQDNEFDPFAIQILYQDKQLGFVPRKLAKIFSFHMDIMGTEIECKVRRKYGSNIQVVTSYK